jgi:hypothetical protein
MSGKLTASIEITMSEETAPGVFHSALTIQQMKPRKRLNRVLDVNAVVATGSFLSNEDTVFKLRSFLESSAQERLPDFTKSSSQSSTVGTPTVIRKSSAFEMEPKNQIVTYTPESTGTREFIVLTNMSSATQSYHILISYPFYTEIPLDGEIASLGILEIPLKIHPQVFVNYIPEYIHFSVHGFISVFNQQDSKVMSSSLVGVYRDCLTMETKPGVECIQFSQDLKILEKQTKRFIIRNKVPFDISCDAKIVLVNTPANSVSPPTKGSNKKSQAEWSPYTLSITRVTFKSWETTFFDVHFQSHVIGEFEAVLKLEYFEDEYLPGRGTKKAGPTHFPLTPEISFNATVGGLDLILYPDCIMFGHCELGMTTTRVVTITNTAPVPGEFVFYASSPEFSWPFIKCISATSKLDVTLSFSPQTAKSYHEMFYINFDGVTKNIPIHAECHEKMPLSRFVTSTNFV